MAKHYLINEVFGHGGADGPTVQGEGARAGTACTFVRFSKCNLKCNGQDGQPLCDTEFASGEKRTLDEIAQLILAVNGPDHYTARTNPDTQITTPRAKAEWLVVSGGEPALQLDREFCDYFHALGYKIAVETNGTIELPKKEHVLLRPSCVGYPDGQPEIGTFTKADWLAMQLKNYCVDWICVSPKSAEHTIKQPVAHEVKYCRGATQGIPQPACRSLHKCLSPKFMAGGVSINDVPLMEYGALENCMRLIRQNPDWRLSVQNHKLWRAP